jgi:magnesium transporter
MITAYIADQGRLRPAENEPLSAPGVAWIDLFNPSPEEEQQVGAALGVAIPSRADMEEIEQSSRLYLENGAAFMTATLPSATDSDDLQLAPVTFLLTPQRLVTIRYHAPRPFKIVPAHANRGAIACCDGPFVLVALLEAQIDRLADVLERVNGDFAKISRQVFQRQGDGRRHAADFRVMLESIGRKGDLTSSIMECLASLERLFGFLSDVGERYTSDKGLLARIRTLAHDCRSLLEYADSLTHKIGFLLDAMLGLINIEQSAITKIFSVVAVVFLPPTLIASIYGMNFKFMPELQWPFGYLFALLLMVLSAVLPFWYFKHRRWL